MFRSRGRSRWTGQPSSQHTRSNPMCVTATKLRQLCLVQARLEDPEEATRWQCPTQSRSVLRKDVRAAAVPQTQEAPDHRPAAGQNVPAREKPGFVLYRGKFLLRLGASRSEPGSRLTPSGWLAEEGLFPRKQTHVIWIARLPSAGPS